MAMKLMFGIGLLALLFHCGSSQTTTPIPPPIPLYFVRSWYYTNVSSIPGSFHVGIAGGGLVCSEFGNPSSCVLYTRTTQGGFFCNNNCEQAVGCYQNGTDSWSFAYMIHLRTTYCHGLAESQRASWGEDSDSSNTGGSLTIRSNGPGPGFSVEIKLMCDMDAKGPVSEFTPQATVLDGTYSVSLSGSHRCACLSEASSAYCNADQFVPKDPLLDFSQSVTEAIEKCDASTDADLDLLCYVSVGIVLVCWVLDIIVACRVPRPFVGNTRWQSYCCGFLNVLSSPDMVMLPTKKYSRPLLLAFGTGAATFVILGTLMQLALKLLPDDASPMMTIVVCAIQMIIITWPAVSSHTTSIQQIGNLVGLCYSIYGAQMVGQTGVCYARYSQSVGAAFYLPSCFCFVVCALVHLSDIVGWLRRTLSSSTIRGKRKALHATLTCGVETPMFTVHSIVDTSAYVKHLLGSAKAKANTENEVEVDNVSGHNNGVGEVVPALNINSDVATSSTLADVGLRRRVAAVNEAFPNEYTPSTDRIEDYVTSGTLPAQLNETASESYHQSQDVVSGGNLEKEKDASISLKKKVLKSGFVTPGETRIYVASVLSTTMLMGLWGVWASMVELILASLEALLTSGRCCTKQSCYTAAGGLGDTGAAGNWMPANVFLSEVMGTAESSLSIGLTTPCTRINDFRAPIRYSLLFAGVLPIFVCLALILLSLRTLHRWKADIQMGSNHTVYLNTKAKATSGERVQLLQYVGTQTAYSIVGWLINTALLSIFALITVPLAVVYNFSPTAIGDYVEDIFWHKGSLGWVSWLLINMITLQLYVYFVGIRNSMVLNVTCMFEQVFYTLNGFVGFLIRTTLGILMFLVNLTRLDESVLPGRLWSLDVGFSLFRSLVQLDAYYSNRIMLAFVRVLLTDVNVRTANIPTLSQLRGNGSASSSSYVYSQPLLGGDQAITTTTHVKRARNRWHLAYTLIHNPKLILDRRTVGRDKRNLFDVEGLVHSFVAKKSAAMAFVFQPLSRRVSQLRFQQQHEDDGDNASSVSLEALPHPDQQDVQLQSQQQRENDGDNDSKDSVDVTNQEFPESEPPYQPPGEQDFSMRTIPPNPFHQREDDNDNDSKDYVDDKTADITYQEFPKSEPTYQQPGEQDFSMRQNPFQLDALQHMDVEDVAHNTTDVLPTASAHGDDTSVLPEDTVNPFDHSQSDA